MKGLKTIASVAGAGALLVAPAIGQANKPVNGVHNHPTGTAKSCAKKSTVNKGVVIKGTLVTNGYTPDNAQTANVNELSVTITVTGQNRHARRAGLTDADTNTAGTQYRLNHADDAFRVQLSDYEANEAPGAGDKVRVIGKVAVTKKKCAQPNATLADRYGDINVRKVKVIDAD